MKMKATRVCFVLLFGAAVTTVSGQDAVKVAPKNFKVLEENQYVRVIQDTLAPGEKEPMHTHPAGWYYVTQPGTMKVTYADGKSITWDAKPGERSWMDAEAAHTSENIGKTTIQYVLVEVKGAAKP
jgi:quercetin dioxygenase-like cupin family protein